MAKLIFYVDDDLAVRTANARLMRRLRPTDTVIDFGNPLELFEAVRDGGRPDLVITDRTMGPTNGEDLARLLQVDLNHQGPIVMLTGDAGLSKIPHVTQIVAKPISRDDLAALLAHYLDKH